MSQEFIYLTSSLSAREESRGILVRVLNREHFFCLIKRRGKFASTNQVSRLILHVTVLFISEEISVDTNKLAGRSSSTGRGLIIGIGAIFLQSQGQRPAKGAGLKIS